MSGNYERFAALHVPGNPLVLYNVWDVGSALAVVAARARALATGSHPVADANGFADGEGVPIDFALANAKRIVDAVELPVSIDFEGAYSVDPEEGAANMKRLAATGAVGCNFEDQVIGGVHEVDGGVHPLDLQCRRIAAARRAVGDAFFINARTDVFLRVKDHDDALADQAIERAKRFADAGASGFFVPRLGDLKLVERVCRASPIPVNAIAYPGAPSRAEWAGAGIARISHGPFPHKAAMAAFTEAARAAIES
ncbi:MAG: isocitrate lyase/phosphoenolpyruvate mutase family protein [Pseudomonadota bacterium]|nr:isocitrate lyase/phosphoenolpyruvate mutase family protein [Pseudomonadota bacterium]